MFLIVSGRVEVFDVRGGARVSLAHLGPGQCVGEMALIDDRPRSANVEAVEDTLCFLMTRDGFNGLTKRDPEVLWGIVPLIVERLRHADARLAEVAARDAASAVADRPLPIANSESHSVAMVTTVEPPARAPYRRPTAANEWVLVESGDGRSAYRYPVHPRDDSLLAALTHLATASVLLSSSFFLFTTQEMLKLMAQRGSLGTSLRESEQVISSLTSRIQKDMSDASRQMLETVQQPLITILSLFDR